VAFLSVEDAPDGLGFGNAVEWFKKDAVVGRFRHGSLPLPDWDEWLADGYSPRVGPSPHLRDLLNSEQVPRVKSSRHLTTSSA
jgi:hypothetical protein